MSFVISIIYQQKDVYIAADTKSSSKSGLKKYDDVHKIKSISDCLCIGTAGDFIFGSQLIEQNTNAFQQAKNIEEIEQILSEKALINNTLWRAEYNVNADCVFMPVSRMREQPYISLTTLSEGKV